MNKSKQNSMDNYFLPQKNTEFEVFQFGEAVQQEEETLAMYHTRLVRLAKYCEFDNQNKQIKSHIIRTCKSSSVRRRALKEPELSLNDILAYGRALETSDNQASNIEAKSESANKLYFQSTSKPRATYQGQSTSNNYQRRSSFKQQQQPVSRPNQLCRNCGISTFPHPGGRFNCPAYGSHCDLCGKMNHFSSVCLSKPETTYRPVPAPRRTKQRAHQISTDHQISNNPTDGILDRDQGFDHPTSSDDEYTFVISR